MILIEFEEGKGCEQYIEVHNKYAAQYGKVCILYQCGAFFEVYGKEEREESGGGLVMVKKLGDIYAIAAVLGLVVGVKATKGSTKENDWLMTGFNPVYADKYVPMLVENAYTVVLIEQLNTGAKPKRAITRVISSATYMEDMTLGSSSGSTTTSTIKGKNNKVLMSAYMEFTRHGNFVLAISMAALDVSLGESVLYTVYSRDKELCMDECFRFIHSMGPAEMMFYTEKEEHLPLLRQKISDIGIDSLGCQCHTHVVSRDFLRPVYQQSFLDKFFPDHGALHVLDWLHLTIKPSLVVAFCVMLQFTYEHDETLTHHLHKPRFWDQTEYLTIENNGIYQLNVVKTHNIKQSLVDMLDYTRTSVGKRLHKQRLLNPVVSPVVLNGRYAQIAWMLLECRYSRFEVPLKKIADIERLHRKIENGTVSPQHFMILEDSYREISTLLDMFVVESAAAAAAAATATPVIFEGWTPTLHEHFSKWRQAYLAVFNMGECQKYNRLSTITGSFFNRGVNPAIDTIQDQIQEWTSQIYTVASQLSQAMRPHVSTVGTGGGGRRKKTAAAAAAAEEGEDEDGEGAASTALVKVERTDRDGYYYSVSKGRTDAFKKYAEPVLAKIGWDVGSLTYNKMSATKLTMSNLTKINQTLEVLQEQLQDQCKSLFLTTVQELYESHKHIFPDIVLFIGDLDWAVSAAKCAHENYYSRPQIEPDHDHSGGSSKSYLRVKALRHPMIEKMLATSTHYVPNDIYLGDGDGDGGAPAPAPQTGMLLFGTNSSGKSSLMKSVGVCIIMAQSGLYVPCDMMKYYPYLNILTRITGEDNFSKGFSSFVVEMVELRTILLRSTPRSLVLGDEICHGTEQTSALAIVASSIIELAHKQCNFIFATHLHALCTMPAIAALQPKVQCWHLKVNYDEVADALVYNRKLAAGGGTSVYGLEVAKYIIQDNPEFIERCLELRKKIMDVPTQPVSSRASKYNAKLVVDKCKICGKHADDTHHINFQCTADESGCIDGTAAAGAGAATGVKFHKHALANLVALCKTCHIKVHHSVDHKKIFIHGYEQTSKGTVLRWNEIET
jgi:DNA mismatch repair protein MutS